MGNDTKYCPFCAEVIKAEANVCRFCGRDLQESTVQDKSSPPSSKKRSPIKRLLMAIVVSVIIVCCGLYMLVSIANDGSLESSTLTEDVEQEAIQTTPTEDLINTTSLTPTEKVSALLPGLKPEEVTAILEERGLTCSSAEQGQLYYVRTCNDDTSAYSLNVQIYGRESSSIDFIDSTVLQFDTPDNDFSASFLGFVATMPYEGAVQEESRSWVEAILPTLEGEGDVREEVFAGVNYRLFGLPTAITLEMGNLP